MTTFLFSRKIVSINFPSNLVLLNRFLSKPLSVFHNNFVVPVVSNCTVGHSVNKTFKMNDEGEVSLF